jgi:hypothetical protein
MIQKMLDSKDALERIKRFEKSGLPGPLLLSGLAIDHIPYIPSNATHLFCDFTEITSIPELPPSIIYLNCSNNLHLTKLPILPEKLEILFCKNTNVESLPDLPQSLLKLNCSNTEIKILPPFNKNKNLTEIYCNESPISLMGDLPPCIKVFSCANCPIKCLPYLPNSLKELYCYNTMLPVTKMIGESIEEYSIRYRASLKNCV